MCFFFFLMIGRPPRSTLFPYTALSRSARHGHGSSIARTGAHQLALRDKWNEKQNRQRGHRRARSNDIHVRRSEEHTSELQSRQYLVCRLLLEKKNKEQRSDAKGEDEPG